MHSTAAGLWETSTRNLKAQAIVEDAVWNDKDKLPWQVFHASSKPVRINVKAEAFS